MAKAILFIVGLSLLYISVHCNEYMSPEVEKQIEDAKKMVQQVCQPKFKIPDDVIAEAMATKNPPTDKNFKCFLHCTLEMIGIMKKNKPDFDGAKKQIEMFLPENVKPKVIAALDTCKKEVQVVKNACDNALSVILCFRDNVPDFAF